MAVQIYPVLWPDEEQYAGFREMFGDEIPPTVEAYRLAERKYVQSLGYGGLFKEVPFELENLRELAGREIGNTRRHGRLRLAFTIWEKAHEGGHGRNDR